MRVRSVAEKFEGKSFEARADLQFPHRLSNILLDCKGRTLVTDLANSQSENLRKYDRFLTLIIKRGAAGTKVARRGKTRSFPPPLIRKLCAAELGNISFDFVPCPRLTPPRKKYRHCRYRLHSTVMKSPVIRITVTPCLSPYPDHHAPFRSPR